MRYALLIYGSDDDSIDLPEEEKAELRAAQLPRWYALFGELRTADPNVTGKELDSSLTAKVVQMREGERIVSDGPYAETKELIGGLFLIELPDLDEAIRLAARIPAADHGSIEIRPIATA
jgi:hypothetical protein